MKKNDITPLPFLYQEEVPANEPDRQTYFIDLLRDWMVLEKERLQRPMTYHVQTFGCQMNAKDSEKLAGILEAIGYKETDTETADFVLYNTCTVRENANSRVYGRIGYLGKLKQKNPGMKIVMCGCMMQEAHVIEKLKKSYRFVDVVFGTHNIYMLAELLYNNMSSGRPVFDIREKADKIVEDLPSSLKYSFKAGVNIMYGCNNFCSYCIVPYVRGRERSRAPIDIINEITALTDHGIVEIMLLGQNVNSYGMTLEEPISFAQLLQMIEKIEKLKRIRFMTPHPKDLSDELISVIKKSDKICKHLHLPLQSGSTEILKKMNRKYTKEDYLTLVRKAKAEIPDLTLTTDIIVGFPGETEEDFNDTIDVIEKVGFASAYTFQYSKRTGTAAASMNDQISPAIVEQRFSRLLSVVQHISEQEAKKSEGSIMEVLVEEQNEQTPGFVTGRLSNNLLVHFPGTTYDIGSMKNVHLKECKGFYYIGEAE